MGTQEIKVTDADHPYAKENGVVWAEEAWERVKHAPEFVRPGIRKLMVQRCVKRGFKIVTSDFSFIFFNAIIGAINSILLLVVYLKPFENSFL